MTDSKPPLASVIILTSLALIAFAANSLLCRAALGSDSIDPASFTAIRLGAGIVVLMIFLTKTTREGRLGGAGSWSSAFMLFLYATGFSYAYVHLDVGTGALILFGMVQVTIVLSGTVLGEKLAGVEWLGLALALGGLFVLVMAQLSMPTFRSSVLMGCAGIAWGLYTVRGRESQHPIADTAYNFARTAPFVLILVLLSVNRLEVSWHGALLAMISGSVASAMGYALWYSALRGLTNTESAVVQLAGPVLAAAGGVLLLSEEVSWRLLSSGAMVLGGIALVVMRRKNTAGAS